MALAEITQPLFFTVAIINALIGTGALLVLVAWASNPPFWPALKKHFSKHGIKYAFTTATLATLGSLWLSEISGIPPCKLCWYQRVAMYPLIVVLGVGILKRKSQARLTGLLLAGAGFLIAGYHYLVQRAAFWRAGDLNSVQQLIINVFQSIGLNIQAPNCAVDASCSVMYLGYWGFYSIPLFALVSFFVILVALYLYKEK